MLINAQFLARDTIQWTVTYNEKLSGRIIRVYKMTNDFSLDGLAILLEFTWDLAVWRYSFLPVHSVIVRRLNEYIISSNEIDIYV